VVHQSLLKALSSPHRRGGSDVLARRHQASKAETVDGGVVAAEEENIGH